jgi:hypothetical protein
LNAPHNRWREGFRSNKLNGYSRSTQTIFITDRSFVKQANITNHKLRAPESKQSQDIYRELDEMRTWHGKTRIKNPPKTGAQSRLAAFITTARSNSARGPQPIHDHTIPLPRLSTTRTTCLRISRSRTSGSLACGLPRVPPALENIGHRCTLEISQPLTELPPRRHGPRAGCSSPDVAAAPTGRVAPDISWPRILSRAHLHRLHVPLVRRTHLSVVVVELCI